MMDLLNVVGLVTTFLLGCVAIAIQVYRVIQIVKRGRKDGKR
jgi:hypothetical protein